VSRLREKIVRLIKANGPLPVADYMALCLFDPDDGYYTTREPFGAAGDFTTAPEISQMFGELIGVWVLSTWQAIGRPSPFTLAEIGPGRGTLMKDLLRTVEKLDPGFAEQSTIAMVETSPRLADMQKTTLGDAAARVAWRRTIAELPEQPLIIVGNELFDAIPIHQFVKTAGQWLERAVGLDAAGALRFAAAPGAPDPALLPAQAAAAPDGAVVEIAPARIALMEAIAARIASQGGAGLFIDYGHLQSGIGDTLQAVRAHQPADVLDAPGEADLTAHVDFAALGACARSHGLDAHLATQGDFLLGMGFLERAGRLGADADAAVRERLQSEVDRLAGPAAMGKLFKVLALAPAGTRLPPFHRSD
jgi:SAM-dependent MidA family methyltransferase